MTNRASDTEQASKLGLLPVLGFWDLVVYGLTYVSPIGPWSTWGYASVLSGGAVAMAYGLGALALCFTALSYAQMASAVPQGGSVYAYAREAMGKAAGFMSGWMILLDYLLLPALMYVFFAIAMSALVPAVPRWAWILLSVHVMAEGTLPMFTQQAWWQPTTSASSLLSATSLCVMAYLGFDAITTLSPEVQPQQRHLVGRALLFCLVFLGALAVLQVWLYSDLSRGLVFEDPSTATFEMVAARISPVIANLITWAAALIVAVSIAPTMVTGVSRVLHAMAMQGEMPRSLGRIHPRYAVPHMAILFSGGLSIVVALCFATQFDTLTTMVNFGALCAFMSVNASVVCHFMVKQSSRRWVHHLVVPVLGIGVLLAVMSQMPTLSLVIGASWAALGALVYVVSRRGHAAAATA
jgi:amino acid transporter